MIDILIEILSRILDILVFPGFIGAVFIGGTMTWFSRKSIARFQSRRGPPISQPWSDLIKLLAKEQSIPITANKFYFYLGPFIALTGSFMLTLLFPLRLHTEDSLGLGQLLEYGDLVVAITMLLFVPIGIIIGGVASGNPYSTIGSSREGSIILALELPLAISLLTPSIAYDGIFNLESLQALQIDSGWFIFKFPFATCAFFVCIIVKLGLKPFDMTEARQEIIAGPLTEFSGPLLGIYEIAKYILWFGLSGLFSFVFLGGTDGLVMPLGIFVFLIKSFVIVFLLSLVDALSARLRIDQGFKVLITSVLILSLVDPLRLTLGLI